MREFSRNPSYSIAFLFSTALVGGCASGDSLQHPAGFAGGNSVAITATTTVQSPLTDGTGRLLAARTTSSNAGETSPALERFAPETASLYRTTIDDSEYQEGVQARETRLQESATALAAAETALTEAEASLLSAQANLQTALDAFGQAESSGNGATLDTAWAGVSNALFQWTTAKESYDSSDSEFDDAQKDWQKNSIGLEQYKNDYEAQSSPFAIRDDIARCRTAECSADSFLDDERFTVFQPNVLEMVGAHYAYAKGLTGKEIRIGIEDDAANYTLPEFAGRVSFAGATVLYPVYDGDDFLSDASLCQRTGLNCRLITYSSEHADLETLTARWIIAKHGWPADGERWFIRNDYHEAGSLGSLLGLRWREIPDATSLSHGTTVASVAAGRDFGIAPGATVVPIFKDFRYRNQAAERHVLQSLLYVIDNLSKSNRDIVDQALAIDVAYEYANFDIINRSYGIGVFDPVAVSELLNDETQWWGEGLRQILPRTWRAYMQTETHPDDRTILVYAAGNELQEFSGLGADIPYYVPHVRGSQLSVMAVDHDGSHTSYTNFCGAVPPDWDPERWGRHFCLAAPGTVNSAGSGGQGFIVHEAGGTSFAAPVVTGAIALLMEHFRGQLGATEIVKRVVNTANNRGRYAQIEIYGAGLLDLEAALQPVGTVMTGTPSEKTSTLSTVFQVPAAMGSLGRRLAGRGVEVASLDALGAPFWSSPERLLRQTAYQSVIPKFTDPEWTPHRGFTPRVSAGPVVKGFQTLLS